MVLSIDDKCFHGELVYTASQKIVGLPRSVPLYRCTGCGEKSLFSTVLGGSINTDLYDAKVVQYNGLILEKTQ